MHPAATAWLKWLASPEGTGSSEPFPGHLEKQYLENRLHRAFMAGYNTCADVAIKAMDANLKRKEAKRCTNRKKAGT